jgi:hypothetical protein
MLRLPIAKIDSALDTNSKLTYDASASLVNLGNNPFNMMQVNQSTGSLAPIQSARDAKAKQLFFKGCVEALLLDRKDRTTLSGQNKLAESLNKLLLNNCELAKLLLLKRVNEITARMFMISLKPGQFLNLEEPALYIVIDGMARVATH